MLDVSNGFFSSPARCGILIALLAATVYANSIGGDFVWDDLYVLSQNLNIRDIGNIPNYFISTEKSYAYDMKVYRPLRQTMFAVEYQLFGLDPRGYHVVNVVLHALNSVLVFVVCRRLTGDVAGAFLIGLLFSVHPLTTEVVANITGRTDLLFAAFFLLGVYFRLDSRDRAIDRRFHWIVILAYCGSLLSKEMAVVFPLVIVLLDLYRQPDVRTVFRVNMPTYLALGAVTVGYMVLRTAAIGDLGRAEYYGDSLWTTFYSSARIFFLYLKLFFIPYPLSARYDLLLIESPLNPYVVGFIASLLVLGAMTLRALYRKHINLVVLGGWWLLITLLPVSNLIPIRAAMMGERYLYIPMLGLFLCLYGLFAARQTLAQNGVRRLLAGAGSVAVVIFFSLTVQRNAAWADNLTLFEDTAKKAPDMLVVHWHLFEEYKRLGDNRKAATEYREMKRINLKTATEFLDIARRYRGEGRLADAQRMARSALRTKPDFAEAEQFLASLVDPAQAGGVSPPLP
jgi:hypothetical protein